MRAELEEIEGVESLTLKTTDGKTIVLKAGEPALVKDPSRQLVAAFERLPVEIDEEDDGA